MKVCPRARTASSTPVPSDRDVTIYLHTTLTYRAPTLVFSDEKRSFAIPGAGAVLRGDAYISAGCDAAQLVRDALALLAGQKLDVLGERIRYSAEKIGNVATVSLFFVIFAQGGIAADWFAKLCCAGSVGDPRRLELDPQARTVPSLCAAHPAGRQGRKVSGGHGRPWRRCG